MDGPRGGERKTEAHALLSPNLHHGPRALRPATQARAQQPGPTTRMALHAGRGLAPGRRAEQRPTFPAPAEGAAPLAAPGPQVYKPRGCAFGSQTHSMWLPGLVLRTKQSVEWLLCIFLHQRDNLLHSPFVLKRFCIHHTHF